MRGFKEGSDVDLLGRRSFLAAACLNGLEENNVIVMEACWEAVAVTERQDVVWVYISVITSGK